jgi:hypothetical protein
MLCLSVNQPWGECVVLGKKTIETRTWWPRVQLPVLVAIHAGKHVQLDAPARVWQTANMRPSHPSSVSRMGGIIGVARFVDRVRYGHPIAGRSRWAEDVPRHLAPLEWWHEKRVGLVLDNPVRFPTVLPCRGQLGLYRLEPDLVESIRRELHALLERRGLRDDDGTWTLMAEGKAVASALAMLGDPVRVAGGVHA